MNRLICRITSALASTWAIVGVLVLCFALYAAGIGVEVLVFALSVFSLTFTQFVLQSGDRDTRAIQAKLDSLIAAIDGADDGLIGAEKRL